MTTMTHASAAIEKSRSTSAARLRVQLIMNHSGDTRYEFDAADAQDVALAEERFRQLTGSGFRAAVLSGMEVLAG